MAVLEQIRVKFGVAITVIIALALLSFIIDPNTLSSVSQSMSSKYDVGEINGKAIRYQDFQNDVDRYTKISEMVSGSVQSEAQQQNIRNAAWQALIDKYLFIKNAKAAGITVGTEEMLALTTGDMTSPILAQDPAFLDENGNFSSERLIQFVQAAGEDEAGQLKIYWDYLQNAILTNQYYAKYGSIFSQSNIANPLMVAKSIEENNTATSAEFVMVPFGFETDSTIVVSDSEISKYYNDHKKFYKQPASRDIEYVLFEVVPSAQDIAAANAQIADVYDEFATTDNMKSFLLKNSDRSLSNYWYKAGELSTVSRGVSEFVDANATGAVSSVIAEGNTFYAVKVLATAKRSESIDVKIMPVAPETEAVTDSLATVLDALEAMQMTQTYMIAGCEELFNVPVDSPVIFNNVQYGKLLAKVVSKSEPVQMKQVAILEKEALASKETFNEYYSKANTLATKSAGKYDAFKAAVAEDGLLCQPVSRMLESNTRLGIVDNAKEVTRWAFEQKKAGAVSNIITVNNNYFFVVALKSIHKDGYANVKEVAPSIKNLLYSQKASEKKAADIAEKIKGLDSMEAIAEVLGTNVSTNDNITFASMGSQGLDPKFIGAVSAAKEGEISAPLAGTIGVYVYKVLGREVGSFYSEEDARRTDFQKSNYESQMLLPAMMDAAGVVDNRARFF